MKGFTFQLASLESDLVFRAKPSPLPACRNYIVIGDEEFNIGEAWYCQDKVSGSITRVSPEYAPPVQFVNSSMRRFKASLKAAAQWSAQHDTSAIMTAPRVVEDLAKSLLKIDRKAFASPEYHWPLIIDHLRTYASEGDEEMEIWFRLA